MNIKNCQRISMKILSVILSLIMIAGLLFTILNFGTAKVSAASNVTLADLQAKFPAGKYWNHAGSSTNNPDGYTSTPCTHHGNCSKYGYNGWCGCNSFGSSIQCFGFANKLAYDAYGSLYTSWSTTSLSNLKAGDVIRYKNNGHSIFVTGVLGDTITYGDCNSDGHCKIRWGVTISKSTVAATLTAVYSAPSELSTNDSYVDLGTDFYALILNTKCWMPIENNNSNIVLGRENRTKSQLWRFEKQLDNSYKIISLADNKVIDLCNFGNTDGTNIQMCGSNDSDAQRWFFKKYNGAYTIIPKCSQNGAMDLTNNDSTYGTNIQFFTQNNTSAQIFSVYKIDNIIEYLSCNVGDVFNSLIINTNHWKPIENNDGSNVVLGTENFSKSQLWRFERQGDNSYKIISLADNKVIDLTNYGSDDGTNIQMCVSNDEPAQRWYIIENNNGYSLIPKCSQNGAMDLDGNKSEDGTNIHFWTYHGKEAQTFTIYQIDSVPQYLAKDFGNDFIALIKHTTSNKPVENSNDNIVLNTENHSKCQLWKFERQSDNSYKIISLVDNKVIDLTNYGSDDGTNIQMSVSNDEPAQRWYIIENNNGYSLIPKCSQNGAMDLDGNKSEDGTNIHFWTYHGKDSQTYTIEIIDNVNLYLNLLVLIGDVNNDGDVTIDDVTLIQKYIANISELDSEQLKTADVTGDGDISIDDVTTIQKYLASMIAAFATE